MQTRFHHSTLHRTSIMHLYNFVT